MLSARPIRNIRVWHLWPLHRDLWAALAGGASYDPYRVKSETFSNYTCFWNSDSYARQEQPSTFKYFDCGVTNKTQVQQEIIEITFCFTVNRSNTFPNKGAMFWIISSVIWDPRFCKSSLILSRSTVMKREWDMPIRGATDLPQTYNRTVTEP